MKAPGARTGVNLSSLVSAYYVVPDHDPGMMIRMHAMQRGHEAAGWLVRSARRAFVRAGEVDFVVPAGHETPPWMRVALEYLRRSPRHAGKWQVTTFRRRGANDGAADRVHRVAWMDWAYYLERRETGAWPTRSESSTHRLGRARTSPGRTRG